MKTPRPLLEGDYVRIISGNCSGNTGVVVRIVDYFDEGETRVAVAITGSGFDHGIWFSHWELKRVGARPRGAA